MDPSMWGPKCWYMIHSIALTYPEEPTQEDQEKYKVFFNSLGDVLPCMACSEHYKKNVKQEELNKALQSNKALFNWTVDLHNKVNKFQNKRQYSYVEALESLENDYTSFFDYKLLIIIILVLYIVHKHNS